MNLEKLPLAERLRRLEDYSPAYPEYTPAVIRGFGETPVMEYLAGVPPEKQRRFCEITGISGKRATYQQAALRISSLPSRLALEAMRILAEPMIRFEEERTNV